MLAFMKHNMPQFRRRQLRKYRRRYEKARREEADHTWRIYVFGCAEFCGPRAALQKCVYRGLRGGRLRPFPDAPQMDRVHQEASAAQKHKDDPERGDGESPFCSQMHHGRGYMRLDERA